MDILFAIFSILLTFSIPFMPLSPGFFPRLGLLPLRLGHDRRVRAAQVTTAWAFALFSLWLFPSAWGWVALGLAVLALVLGAVFFPQNIFVALGRPQRTKNGLAAQAPVFVVSENGETVAYPVDLIVPHHIVNDEIGGTPVLISWCAACRGGNAYRAEVDGQRLTFQVYGVWRRNMVILDRETGSVWQQATGECVDGALKGRQLDLLFGQEMTWAACVAGDAGAQFALAPERHTGLLPKARLMRLLAEVTPRAQLDGLGAFDRRLQSHEVVIGVVVDGVAKAYSLAQLKASVPIQDQVGGQSILLEYQPETDVVVVRTADGALLRHERQWWLGWSEFHPRTEVYQ